MQSSCKGRTFSLVHGAMDVIFVLLLVVACIPLTHAQYNQYFGASNYFGVGQSYNQGYNNQGYNNQGYNQGYWYVQAQCPWGSTGYRTPSSFQCGSYTCPSMWFGTSTYTCPMGTIYSNSLQMCVSPVTLANNCRRRMG